MPKYVAFLRAVNVGGHIVKMDYLRTLFEALGFANVETFIASGNVIFDSSAKNTRSLEKKIESSLEENLGYEVKTFVRSTAELATIADYKPFAGDGPDCVVYVGFLEANPAKEAQRDLLNLATPADQFHTAGRELYWLCGTKFSDSKISGALLTKTIGMPTTLRNSNTVKRLAAKYSVKK